MTVLMEVTDLIVDHTVPVGLRRRRLRAVDGVTLRLGAGEIVGLVGESGCGKSTLARAVVGLVAPERGTVSLAGRPLPARRSADDRRRVQMVFQDPGASLDPRLTVRQTLAGPLRRHRIVPAAELDRHCRELLARVGLAERVLDAYPRRLSGGQRQRVAIARALAVEPDVLVADEAVAALDASVAGAVLGLLAELRSELGLTVLFISHDLSAVRGLCDRVAVMYLGRLVEEGPVDTVFADPGHPYTAALLAAVPRLHDRDGTRVPLLGEPPNPLAVPPGCSFHPRCPIAAEACAELVPDRHGSTGHQAWCHRAWQPVPDVTRAP